MPHDGPFRAAFVERPVTPEAGCPLTGFIDRTEPSRDVRDDLFARLVMLEHAGTRAALVTVDMLGTDIPTATEIRRKLAAIIQTTPDHILLNASHTHAGPATIELEGVAPANRDFLARLDEALCDLARQAMVSHQPARLIHRRGIAPGVATIRRWPGQGPASHDLDATLDVLSLERESGDAIGHVVCFACHAVAAGKTLSLSADYPGVMVRRLRESLGGAKIAFAQGCCGDLNPVVGVSDHDAADQAGRQLALAVENALAHGNPTAANGPIRCATAKASLPLDDPPPREELQQLVEDGRRDDADAAALAMASFARRTLALIDSNAVPEAVDVPVQTWLVGADPPLRIVALPGEPISSLAAAIRQDLPGATVVMGYANGLMGYVTDRPSHQAGGYEVDVAYRYYGYPARFDAEAGDVLIRTATNLAERLEREVQTASRGVAF